MKDYSKSSAQFTIKLILKPSKHSVNETNESEINESEINESEINEHSIINESEINEHSIDEHLTREYIANGHLANGHSVGEDLVNEDLVNEDLVDKDLVNKDLVDEDLVDEDLVGKDLVGKDLASDTQAIESALLPKNGNTRLGRSHPAAIEMAIEPTPISSLVPLSLPDWLDFSPTAEQVCLLTDDGSLLTPALLQQLLQQGWQVVVLKFPVIDSEVLLPAHIPQVLLQDWSEIELEHCLRSVEQQYGKIHSVIHLHPVSLWGQPLDFGTEQNILQQVAELAQFLKRTGSDRADRHRPSFLTVTPINQPFPPTITLTQYLETGRSIDRHLAYFVQHCRQECPDLFCRSIAWHPDAWHPERQFDAGAITAAATDVGTPTDVVSIAHLVLAELHDPNAVLTDVVYYGVVEGDRRRFTHRSSPESSPESSHESSHQMPLNLAAPPDGAHEAVRPTRLLDAPLKTYQIRRQLVLAANPLLNDHVIGDHAVMPTVCAVNWIANASAQLYPGYKVLHCSQCKVFKGIVFDESLAPEYFLTLKEVQKSADAIELQGTIWSATQPGKPPRFHFSLQVTLCRELPQPPIYSGFDRTQDPHLVHRSSPYDDGTLFHGPLFQGIQRVLNVAAAKVTTLCVMPQVALEQRGQFPVLSIDPIALDIQYQIMAIWTHQFCQAACMPLSYQRSEHYRAIELGESFYVSMDVQSATASKLIADLTAHDIAGKVYTKLIGAEVTISPQLNPLFFRKR